MKTKIIQSSPALLALMAIGFRYFSQWCIVTNSSCYGTWVHQIFSEVTSPMFYFAVFILPVTLVLMFVSQNAFISWLKLAVWAIPLAIIFIATTPVNFTGIGINFFPFYRDDAARLAGEIFTALSLILVAWKYFATRSSGSV